MQADVLAYDHSNYTLQIANVSPLQVVYIRVAAANPSDAAHNTGNYFLAADFRSWVVQLDTFASGTLTQAQPQAAYQLQNPQSQLYHFVLSANTSGSTVPAAVRMTIYDAAGNVVRSFVAAAGQTNSLDVMLAPGTYTVRLAAGTQNKAQALPNLTYLVRVVVRSDPIGPRVSDTTTAPAGTSSSGTTTTSGSGTTDPSAGTTSSGTTTSGSGSTGTSSSGTTTDSSSSDGSSYTVQKTSTPTSDSSDPYSDPYSDPTYSYSDQYSTA
jgi:hypothetical protein